MGDNPRKVEAVIKGVTADRKQLILSIGNVEMTATQEVKGFKVPAFVQSDTLKITKL